MCEDVKFTVWIGQSAVDELVDEAAKEPKLEIGGVLMGYWADDAAVITGIVGPGPAAVRTWRRFQPDSKWQSQEIARIYQESGRTVTYLGDWHSHPKLPPMPSLLDVRTARKIAQAEESRTPKPLMLILGEDPVSKAPLLAAYRYDRKHLNACKVIVYDGTPPEA